jgi:hypothetical protein
MEVNIVLQEAYAMRREKLRYAQFTPVMKVAIVCTESFLHRVYASGHSIYRKAHGII